MVVIDPNIDPISHNCSPCLTTAMITKGVIWILDHPEVRLLCTAS